MPNPEKVSNDIRPIVIGAYPLAEKRTIAQDASGVIPKGAVLGVITASGKLKRCASASTDGSALPFFVTTREIDAIAGDVTEAMVVRRGDVRADALVFTGVETLATSSANTNNLTFRENLMRNGLAPIDGSTIGRYDN
jgi:hypothetical protein